jgi:hypothetical protein
LFRIKSKKYDNVAGNCGNRGFPEMTGVSSNAWAFPEKNLKINMFNFCERAQHQEKTTFKQN